jgi:hypothetical protein
MTIRSNIIKAFLLILLVSACQPKNPNNISSQDIQINPDEFINPQQTGEK